VKSYLDLAREALKNIPPGYDIDDQNDQTPAWDQAAADRLLAGARAAVVSVAQAVDSGRLPAVKAAAARTWLEVAEGYYLGHALEAARGWDALALLGGAAAELRRRAAEAG
jgi:hypothetical protein